MAKLFGLSGVTDFCPGAPIYTNHKESSLFLSLGSHVDVYFPPRKRSHISAPYVFCGETFEQKKQPSIEVLPDECLFEIFRRLPGAQERCASACVSKRWLSLVSNIRRHEIHSNKETQSSKGEAIVIGNEVKYEVEDQEVEGDGYLTRSLEGKKATDVRLAAIAVGTASRGGLGKLLIRGSNSIRKVTDVGLRAISRGCPSLRVLSLWNLSSVGDEGLFEIAKGCQMLEKLDLCHCPAITDKALLAIAKSCPNLMDLTIESCPNIGNEGLQAVGKCCPNLKSISIRDCPLVGDQGIAGLLSSATFVLTKALSLANCFGIKDQSLGMPQLSSCKSLRSLTIRNCPGFGDASLNVLSKMCPQLQHVELSGLQGITDAGLLPLIENSDAGLVKVNVSGCMNLTDKVVSSMTELHGWTLKVLNLDGCRKISDASLVAIADNCGLLSDLDVSKCAITDFGILTLAGCNQLNLQILSISGCAYVSDKSLPAFSKMGQTLLGLNLQHCNAISSGTIDFLVEQLWRFHYNRNPVVKFFVSRPWEFHFLGHIYLRIQLPSSGSKSLYYLIVTVLMLLGVGTWCFSKAMGLSFRF
ncbi:grr1 family protein [Tripterygium wilfordii]|uniref:Grr1 family protein n=1 Tax=Tripterygium wilfordii TaxID=458696 RepID=A0A7J7DB74_TRIWF|nr:grr1 family protein [Tripterygium wilfordii]